MLATQEVAGTTPHVTSFSAPSQDQINRQKLQQLTRLILIGGCALPDDASTADLVQRVNNRVEPQLQGDTPLDVGAVQTLIEKALVEEGAVKAAAAASNYRAAHTRLRQETGGMFRRLFTVEGQDPFLQFEYEQHECIIRHHVTGEIKHQSSGEVPKHWSKNARDVLISKYFRRGGVPMVTEPSAEPFDGPDWLRPRRALPNCEVGGEISVRQTIRRIVGHWTYVGYVNGYFDPTPEEITANTPLGGDLPERSCLIQKLRDRNALAFYDENVYIILAQMAAPNSPQWFNTGLWWAYGIDGKTDGHYRVDLPHKLKAYGFETSPSLAEHNQQLEPYVIKSTSAYRYVQVHACYILTVSDEMYNGHTGITDWWTTEARIFKYGSGSGANISDIRGHTERLSGGGFSSGPMPFLKVADAGGGALKSGGVTRRAARMVVMNADHPDVDQFIACKTLSEDMVAAAVCGSRRIAERCQKIMDAVSAAGDLNFEELCRLPAVRSASVAALSDDVPSNYVSHAIRLASQGVKQWPGKSFDSEYEGEAYSNVPFQNANHSVRVTQGFYDAVRDDKSWSAINRVDRQTVWTKPARQVEHEIAESAWRCGDPGLQYDTNTNDWNVTPVDGRIHASNPCSEHLRLNDSACNLASLRITRFLRDDGTLDVERYLHVVQLWMVILDISITMSHLPEKAVALNVYNYRDTGLGYADLGAMAMNLGLAYDSAEARAVAGIATALLQGQCHLTSARLAQKLGAYPRFWANREHHQRCVRNHMAALDPTIPFEQLTNKPPVLDMRALTSAMGPQGSQLHAIALDLFHTAYDAGQKFGYRNAEMSVIAPTGTISIVMDADTTSVEPMIGLLVYKTLAGGGTFVVEPANAVKKALRRLGYAPEQAIERVKAANGAEAIQLHVQENHRAVFDTALPDPLSGRSIPWEAHIQMMAAIQPFISGGISKTINMPADASIDDVKRAYRMANDLGIKSLAVYRDGSKLSQPLNIPGLSKAALQRQSPRLDPNSRMKLPWNRKPGIDICVTLGDGELYLKTTCYEDGAVGEIWATYTADQGIIQALLSHVCKTANVALQYGVPLSRIIRSWEDSNFEPKGMVQGHPNIKNASSLMNLMAKLLDFHCLGNTRSLNVSPSANDLALAARRSETAEATLATKLSGDSCPDCGALLVVSGAGCKKCKSCGYAGGCG